MVRKVYPLRRPKFAKGIRSQETRAGAGRAEWAKKWFAALERIDMGGRFGRGRNYAMSGQVVEVKRKGEKGKSAPNVVCVKVQGVRDGAYEVTVDFRVPPKAVRGRIAAAIRREPMLVARLLAGEMPMEVEEIFRKEGYDLYPGSKLEKGPRRYDVVTGCTCPDYANPCKHVFAAMIILGEEIARRPSLLVELRGITMEELV